MKLFFPLAKTLIVGPYLGEFGWELMEWQAYVRKMATKYDLVISISYPASQYFYEGCIFEPHPANLSQSGFGFGKRNFDLNQQIIKSLCNKYCLSSFDTFSPFDLNLVNRFLIGKKKFKKYFEKTDHFVDLVFHFRSFKRNILDNKNYPHDQADIISDFFFKKGFVVGAIGHPDMAYCPKKAIDLRTIEIKKTIGVISNSKLVIGGSSAPMHLASLCGKPIVVWIGDGADIKRYFTYWNPFRAKCFPVTKETFQPTVESVIRVIEKAIQEEGIKNGQPNFQFL